MVQVGRPCLLARVFHSRDLVVAVLSDQKVWKPYLFPSPLEVWEYLCSSFLDGSLEEASWITVKRLVMGYGIGLVMGIPLGQCVPASSSCRIPWASFPWGSRPLPSVCWVPLATLWFGQTEGAMLFVVIMGTLWSVILATANGMRNVPPIYARAARTMGRWPHLLPDSRDAACLRPVCGERDEAGLGLCVGVP